MTQLTTVGLRDTTQPSSALQVIQWAAATGTVSAITATYPDTVVSLEDGLCLCFRATGANTITNPTFAPDGLAARTITKEGGAALRAGDIAGADHEVIVRYNLAGTRWELMNPSVAVELWKVLAATGTGENSTSAQPWFPTAGAVSVTADTTYFFEGVLYTTRAAGTTSHTTGILFGGTATLTDIGYFATCKEGDANDLQDISGFWAVAATSLVVKAASTSATENTIITVRGTVRINAAGTFIPQFIYSAAPGGAPTIKKETYFRMKPIGTGSATSQGTWA